MPSSSSSDIPVARRITWADAFANTGLLEKYWQKLTGFYAEDSLTNASSGGKEGQRSAWLFLGHLEGTREVTETELGIFRRTEILGDGYKVFALTSRLANNEYTVHLAKMAYSESWRDAHPVPLAG